MTLPTAAYIHIPFCRRRCFYCDFPISVVGDRKRGENSLAIAHYVDVLCQEISATSSVGLPLQTIFFGGGTPSLISPAQLHQILDTLRQQFGWVSAPEVSIEMDPGTFTLQQVQDYLSAGINRISLGAQTFQDELLKTCGRSHTVAQIYQAVEILNQAGVTNFGLDLISGLPQQTLEQWQASLTAAVQLSPTHLSTYDLVLEPTTVFGKRYQPGVSPLPTDETAAQMYRYASKFLQSAGYEHYEISNYGKLGYFCRHNLVYWHNRPYYGFGMGATSYVKGQRFSRPRTRVDYFDWVQTYSEHDGQIDCPISTTMDIVFETLMLGLRLKKGLSLNQLDQDFGPEVMKAITIGLEPFQKQGLAEQETSEPTNPRVRLTDPEGFLWSNTILVALWQTLLGES